MAKNFTIFAVCDDPEWAPISHYGHCKSEKSALGNLITEMQSDVINHNPDKYGRGEVEITMSGIDYLQDGCLRIEMSAHEKDTYASLGKLTGYLVESYEIKEEDEE